MKDKASWNKRVVILLLTISALSLANCTARPEFPTGFFLEENTGDVITLQHDGTFTATNRDGEMFISGTYTFTDNELTVTYSDEKMCESVLPESYIWTFDGNILSIRGPNKRGCLLRKDYLVLKLQK